MAMAPKKAPVGSKKTAPAKGQNFGAGYSESDETPKGKGKVTKAPAKGKK